MCLAVPAKLIDCDGQEGVADLHGNQVRVNTLLVPEARTGDWVLMHAGFAIQRLDEHEAEATWAVLDDLQDRIDEEDRERDKDSP
ncbi:MAG: HypC/HybG/HupF family hydrogenase formation chaperone [Phycisphaeraceae bacterium]|nr:HypC/HybG/HupF family hydrogenase formation chaperone [Phycisphaeraceae bacterium]